MTRPSTRTCHQTNSFKGGFVRKVLFLFLELISPTFFSNMFPYSPFLEWVRCQLEGPPDYTREIGSLFLFYLFAEKMIL